MVLFEGSARTPCALCTPVGFYCQNLHTGDNVNIVSSDRFVSSGRISSSSSIGGVDSSGRNVSIGSGGRIVSIGNSGSSDSIDSSGRNVSIVNNVTLGMNRVVRSPAPICWHLSSQPSSWG